MRTRKSVRNVVFSLVFHAIAVASHFVTRMVMLRALGVEALSLNQLFGEIVLFLSMAELGIGSAIVFSIYKPLSDGDDEKLARLMGLYRRAYLLIGGAVMIMGLLFVPFLPFFIDDTISWPRAEMQAIYALFVFKTAASYLFAYKIALLKADQHTHIPSAILSVGQVLSCVLGVWVLYQGKSLGAYVLLEIGVRMLCDIFICREADRRYAFLKKRVAPNKEERKAVFQNTRQIFMGSLSWRIINATDNLLISRLVSTVTVGVYAQYAVFISAAKQVFSQTAQALSGSLGSLMVSESHEKCAETLRTLTFLFFFFALICSVCLYTLVIPLARMVMRAEQAIPEEVLMVCVLNFFLSATMEPLSQMLQISGLFRESKNIAVRCAFINLAVSIVLGKQMGLVGIFIGTTITLSVQLVLRARLLYTKRFGLACRSYLGTFAVYTATLLLQMGLGRLVCQSITVQGPVSGIIVRLALMVPLCALTTSALFCKTKAFGYLAALVRRYLARRKLTGSWE